jgi:hypothetical protein
VRGDSNFMKRAMAGMMLGRHRILDNYRRLAQLAGA